MASPGQNLAKTPENPQIHEIPGPLETISAALEAGNPGNPRCLGNGLRKRSGYCKIDNFDAFVVFPPISAALEAGNPRNTRGLGNCIRKKSGYCEFDDPPISAAVEVGNPGNVRGLGNCIRKRSGYCKIDKIGAFVVFPPFRRPWKQEIQELQGALEMATGKGADIVKSAILVLLSGSSHFGGLGSRKSKKYKEPWK